MVSIKLKHMKAIFKNNVRGIHFNFIGTGDFELL